MANLHPISAVIITLNSSATLEATLKSVAWCDEIIVVDSGSTDETKEICQKYSCKFSFHQFEGFGLQKKIATDLAKYDWILSIDSDEVLTPELQHEIKELLSQGDIPCSGYKIAQTLVFMGKIFKYGKETHQYPLRLFNRKYGNFNSSQVHEKIIVQGETSKLKNILLHYSYRDISNYFEKFNSYSSYASEEAFKIGKKSSKLKLLVKLPLTFFIQYFVYGNFLNGFPGLIWSINSSFYTYVKYLKIYEKYNS